MFGHIYQTCPTCHREFLGGDVIGRECFVCTCSENYKKTHGENPPDDVRAAWEEAMYEDQVAMEAMEMADTPEPVSLAAPASSDDRCRWPQCDCHGRIGDGHCANPLADGNTSSDPVAWVAASDVPVDWEGRPVWHWCEGWRRERRPRPDLNIFTAARFPAAERQAARDVYFALANIPYPPKCEDIE